jgi:RHS repeat-associated protein
MDPTGQEHMRVSSFSINCFAGTRLETSGLGGWRKFYFGDSAGGPGIYSIQAYQLAKLTDFTTASVDPPPAWLPFEWQNYKDGQPRQIWDGRNIQTEAIVTNGDASGQPGEIHHVTADGSYQIFDRVNPTASSDAQDLTKVPNRFNHWLFRHRDERDHNTFYSRDSRRRVKRIDYTDGSYETFSYKVYANGETYNQVETHRMPSGAIQTYEFNETTHLLVREHNSVDGWDARKEYTYYGAGESGGAAGLVKTMSDGRSRAAGKDFSTRMTYNGRHQVLTVEYAGMFNAQNPTMSYGYDAYGNCTSITDELGHTRLYEYDSYRRCIRYTEPLNALDWKGTGTVASRTWDWIYDRYIPETGQRDASTHTKNEWRVQIEPAFNAAGERKMTARWHDLQNRIIRQETGWIQPAGPIPNPPNWYWSGDGEIHDFTYDENGQKSSDTLHIAPSNRVTTFAYDLRNRLWKTNETVNTLPRTTETLYDLVGNKTQVTFPDGETQRWPAEAYTAFGQPRQFFDERNNLTNLEYWPWGPMKKLASVTTHRQRDNGSQEDQLTRFYFDLMGRPQSTYFPDDSSEISTYEFGQLKTWKTRKNQTKTIVYDARGREESHSWNDGLTPAISRSWDAANRLASITNIWSSIDFAYDAAGQVIWEGNDIAGSGTRTQTNYFRYPDGSVAHLYYPGGTYLRKDYTARGQLAAVGWDDDGNNWWKKLAAYTYLPDGKVGQIDFGNGVRTGFLYDQRGFPQIIDHYRPGVQDISWRQYWRDERDRITAFQKSNNPGANLMENGRGDRFDYDDEGQLTDGWYDALDPAGNFHNWARKDHFSYDALGNRQGGNNNLASRNAGQSAISFERRDNGLNQYLHWWPAGLDYVIYHDDNYPGWGPLGNGVIMADGWITASYNALNQPVAIWSPAYSGTSNFMWFGFDPLGRCVKRWVGASGDIYSNPATYFHYDGWNLLQEGNNSWGPSRVYVHGNRVDEIVWSYNTFTGEEAFHQYDARGHATLLTDSNGGILEQYEYDAFGQPYFFNSTAQPLNSSTFGNRFLFTGREWLSDLKVYDFRHRMYQPELGRFMQPDPKHFEAGDYNLYRYCHNDPVNNSDPMGLVGLTSKGEGDWDWFNGDVAFAQISAIAQAATAHTFAPTLAKDNKTAIPSEQSNRGNIYKYQLKSPDGRRVTGPGYTVLEKITDQKGSFPMKKQTEELPLPRSGIFTDDVGLDFRPSNSYNGYSQVRQSFDVWHNGQPIEVSTILGHKVTVENGSVTSSVWVIRR